MEVSGYRKFKQEVSMRQAKPGVWLMRGCHLGLAGRPHHQHRARPAHRQVDLRRLYPHVITCRLWPTCWGSKPPELPMMEHMFTLADAVWT